MENNRHSSASRFLIDTYPEEFSLEEYLKYFRQEYIIEKRMYSDSELLKKLGNMCIECRLALDESRIIN